MFLKIGVLKNFAIFRGKHVCWSLFLMKLQVYNFPMNIVNYFNCFFHKTPLVAANVLLTAVLHFYITWVIYKQFSRKVKANCFPCYNLKIWGQGAKLCEAFLLFLFWKELRYFKVKESMVFVEQNINFNKNETKSKMESTTNSFKEINHVLQLV